MNEHLPPLREAVARLHTAWAGAADTADLSRPGLIAANDALASVGCLVNALKAEVAARIARESRRELGAESLAKQQRFRNPAQLIATATGASVGDATRLVRLGEATAPRVDLCGWRVRRSIRPCRKRWRRAGWVLPSRA